MHICREGVVAVLVWHQRKSWTFYFQIFVVTIVTSLARLQISPTHPPRKIAWSAYAWNIKCFWIILYCYSCRHMVCMDGPMVGRWNTQNGAIRNHPMTILEDVYWSMEMEDGMTQTVAENSRMSVKYHQVIVISFKPSIEVRKTARIRNQCN